MSKPEDVKPEVNNDAATAYFAPGQWYWWAGDDELKTVGPCKTKEQAIEEATGECCGEFQGEDGSWLLGFEVIEARQDPLRLSDWLRLEDMLEQAEERALDNHSTEFDSDPFFECTKAQEQDLIDRVRRTVDDWQMIHRLRFKANTFTDQRNAEDVVVPHPDGDPDGGQP